MNVSNSIMAPQVSLTLTSEVGGTAGHFGEGSPEALTTTAKNTNEVVQHGLANQTTASVEKSEPKPVEEHKTEQLDKNNLEGGQWKSVLKAALIGIAVVIVIGCVAAMPFTGGASLPVMVALLAVEFAVISAVGIGVFMDTPDVVHQEPNKILDKPVDKDLAAKKAEDKDKDDEVEKESDEAKSVVGVTVAAANPPEISEAQEFEEGEHEFHNAEVSLRLASARHSTEDEELDIEDEDALEKNSGAEGGNGAAETASNLAQVDHTADEAVQDPEAKNLQGKISSHRRKSSASDQQIDTEDEDKVAPKSPSPARSAEDLYQYAKEHGMPKLPPVPNKKAAATDEMQPHPKAGS